MPVVSGFLLGLSLILAIGAQNAFVLRQGLIGRHIFAVCLACSLSDVLLIAAGVLGFGALVEAHPALETAMRYGGAAFLFGYALQSARSALKNTDALDPAKTAAGSLSRTLGTCFALTWLNPHVYVDTLVLLGSVSTQFPDRELMFGAGAILGSFVFFFSLGYGARLLRPVFGRPLAWRILDTLIAVIMAALAVGLIAT